MSRHNAAGCSFVAGCVGAGIIISMMMFSKPGSQASPPTTSSVIGEVANIQESSKDVAIPQETSSEPQPYMHGPDFSEFPADEFDGLVQRPDFQGQQRSFRSYRTRISEAVNEGPVFAGSVALAIMGCGTDCSMGYAIDLTNGNIVPLPVGGEPNPDLALDYRRDSNLLKAVWLPNLQNEDCKAEAYYEWNGTEFSRIGSNIPDCGEGGV